jgi:alkanesulfonate monooxygenase SsuD/methylene tetrahydromethanopterin reductase-like flavin-dependent oxidoreductase (luciferase family)
VGETEAEIEAARAGTRALLGFYGSTPAYRRVLESIGRGEMYEPLAARVRAGDFGAVAELVDDHLVAELAIVGSPPDVASRLVDRFGWLADRVSLFFPAEPSDSALAALLGAVRL